jgi:hypothetical protein
VLGVTGGRVAAALGAGPVAVTRGLGVAVAEGVDEAAAGAALARGVGVGVGVAAGRSVRIARGAMGTPARVSTGPCAAGVGVGLGSGRLKVRGDCCAANPDASTNEDAIASMPSLRNCDEEREGA